MGVSERLCILVADRKVSEIIRVPDQPQWNDREFVEVCAAFKENEFKSVFFSAGRGEVSRLVPPLGLHLLVRSTVPWKYDRVEFRAVPQRIGLADERICDQVEYCRCLRFKFPKQGTRIKNRRHTKSTSTNDLSRMPKCNYKIKVVD